MGLYKITANKRFNYSKNVKNIRRREKKKERNQKKLALLTEEAKIIHKHWDHSKGMKSNMSALGLSMDPNKTIKIDKTRYAESYCSLTLFNSSLFFIYFSGRFWKYILRKIFNMK